MRFISNSSKIIILTLLFMSGVGYCDSTQYQDIGLRPGDVYNGPTYNQVYPEQLPEMTPQDMATAPTATSMNSLLNPTPIQPINTGSINRAGIYPIGGQLFVDRAVLVNTITASSITVSTENITSNLTVSSSATLPTTNFTGNITFTPTSNGIVGDTVGNSASAGNVGEFIFSRVDYTNFPATGVFGDLTSITLSAGDWDIGIVCDPSPNGATWTVAQCGISTHSGNSTTGLQGPINVVDISWASSSTTPRDSLIVLPLWRQTISTSTTYYLKYEAAYSAGGPPLSQGYIFARRRR